MMVKSLEREFIFTWKIENVSYASVDLGEFIRSPVISAYSIGQNRLRIDFCPSICTNILAPLDYAECVIKHVSESIGIASKLEVVDRKTLVPLEKIHIKYFCLKKNKLKEILKNNGDTLTFRYHMKGVSDESRSLADSCEAVTKIEIDRGFFKSMVKMRVSDQLTYSVTSYFDVVLNVLEESIKIKINRTEERKARYFCGKCTLIDTKKLFTGTLKIGDFLSKDEIEWISPVDMEKGSDTEMFFFGCEILTGGRVIDSLVYKRGCEDLPKFSTLKDDLRNMYNTMVTAESTVRTDNAAIPIHKAILAARSPSLIDNDTCSVFGIFGHDLETVQNFVRFLYCDELLEADGESVAKLLRLAHDQKVKPLKAYCISFLMANMDKSFAHAAVSAAEYVQCQELKDAAMKFLAENMQTDEAGWQHV